MLAKFLALRRKLNKCTSILCTIVEKFLHKNYIFGRQILVSISLRKLKSLNENEISRNTVNRKRNVRRHRLEIRD